MSPFIIGIILLIVGEVALIYFVITGVRNSRAVSEAIYKRKDEEYKFLEMMREWDIAPDYITELTHLLSKYNLKELIEINKQLESLNYTMYDSNKKHIIIPISSPTYTHYTRGIYG